MPKTKTIAFLAFSPLQELDVFGPVEIFNTAKLFLEKDYEVVLISAGKSKSLVCKSGIQVLATAHYSKFSKPIDTLIIVADPESSKSMPADLVKWIKSYSKKVRRICSICTGSFVLAHTGLLEKKRATTHWLYEKDFRGRFPHLELDISAIWIKDGNVYTSAGVSTGIDLALALVEEDYGSKTALKIAKGLVLFLKRSGSQNQFSRTLLSQNQEIDQFKNLPAWLIENIQSDLSVEKVAKAFSMSSRNFSRLFASSFGMGPGEYVRKIRIDKAKQLLESSDLDWKKISTSCGLPGEALRRAFVREVGISPQKYRDRYSFS